MKLLVLLITIIACDASSSLDSDILAEMNAKIQRLEAKDAEREAENAKLKTKMAAMEAQRNATTAGELKFFVDGRTVCPDGTVEVNATKGMVLLGRPDGWWADRHCLQPTP
jgi:hypothetical protein